MGWGGELAEAADSLPCFRPREGADPGHFGLAPQRSSSPAITAGVDRPKPHLLVGHQAGHDGPLEFLPSSSQPLGTWELLDGSHLQFRVTFLDDQLQNSTFSLPHMLKIEKEY